ncbi:MAG: nitrilase family protein [Bacteroidota bacterium]|nr:nitrilase family protein [Bacteroidota bacterium]
MKITLIQTHLHWENREKNLSHFDNLINSVNEQTDLIVLPEMFTTGFTMNPKQFAENDNVTLEWLKQKAKQKNAVITGSVAINDSNNYFNRLFWVEPNQNFATYDKRHLFRMAKEDENYTAGTKKIIMQIQEWNICPLICYDLRFPIWSRNKFTDISYKLSEAYTQTANFTRPITSGWEYDVLIYVANWPEIRNFPWKQLLIARAIENQCYVIGLNRIGLDGNNFSHSGDSMVINPRGEIISKTKANEESIETILLDKTYLTDFRKAFPVGLDADSFTII